MNVSVWGEGVQVEGCVCVWRGGVCVQGWGVEGRGVKIQELTNREPSLILCVSLCVPVSTFVSESVHPVFVYLCISVSTRACVLNVPRSVSIWALPSSPRHRGLKVSPFCLLPAFAAMHFCHRLSVRLSASLSVPQCIHTTELRSYVWCTVKFLR